MKLPKRRQRVKSCLNTLNTAYLWHRFAPWALLRCFPGSSDTTVLAWLLLCLLCLASSLFRLRRRSLPGSPDSLTTASTQELPFPRLWITVKVRSPPPSLSCQSCCLERSLVLTFGHSCLFPLQGCPVFLPPLLPSTTEVATTRRKMLATPATLTMARPGWPPPLRQGLPPSPCFQTTPPCAFPHHH